MITATATTKPTTQIMTTGAIREWIDDQRGFMNNTQNSQKMGQTTSNTKQESRTEFTRTTQSKHNTKVAGSITTNKLQPAHKAQASNTTTHKQHAHKEQASNTTTQKQLAQKTSLDTHIWSFVVTAGVTSRAKELRDMVKPCNCQNLWVLVPLLALPLAEFKEAFADLTGTRWKAPETRAARLGTLIGLAKALPAYVPPAITLLMQRMKREEKATQVPAWSPGDDQQVATPGFMNTLLSNAKFAPLVIAFVTGQRLSDVMLWRRSSARAVRLASTESVAILVVEGKTVSQTGPYVVHLPRNGLAVRCLAQATGKGPYFFLPVGKILPKMDARKEVVRQQRLLKKTASLVMDLRALRRGGLSLMGATGAPNSHLLALSHHKSEEMLRRYLAAGLLDRKLANTQMQLIRHNENAVQRSTTHTHSFVSPWPGHE